MFQPLPLRVSWFNDTFFRNLISPSLFPNTCHLRWFQLKYKQTLVWTPLNEVNQGGRFFKNSHSWKNNYFGFSTWLIWWMKNQNTTKACLDHFRCLFRWLEHDWPIFKLVEFEKTFWSILRWSRTTFIREYSIVFL